MRNDQPKNSSGLRTAALSLVTFAVLCGLIVAGLGMRTVPYSAPEATSQQHIDMAKKWSLQAERSLHRGNYGEAEESMVELRKHLEAATAAHES